MPKTATAGIRLLQQVLPAAVAAVLLWTVPAGAITTCLPDRTVTFAEVENLVKKYGLPPEQADNAEKGTNLTAVAEDFLGSIPSEIGPVPAILATLPDELGVPAVGPANNFFTHLGGILAVMQLGVELSKGDPMAQLNFGKNAAMYYIGASSNVVKALKIASVGIVLIDYTLNSFGSALVQGRYEWWEKAFRRYHDANYGHKPQDMHKWEKLIYETYGGDWKKFAAEALKDFWKNAEVNAASVGMQQKGMVNIMRNMPADQKEAIRASYLKEMMPVFRQYYTWKRKKLIEEEQRKMQRSYDSMKDSLDEKVIFEGTVTDEAGQPLDGAEVALLDLPPVTAAAGKFEIELRRCELYDAMRRTMAKGGVELKASFLPQGATNPVEQVRKTALSINTGLLSISGGPELAMTQTVAAFMLPVKTVKRLVLSPAEVELVPGGNPARIKAEVEYSDGSTEDVTASPDLTWTFDKQGAVSVDKGNLSVVAAPAAKETVRLTATYNAAGRSYQSSEAVVKVVPPEALLKLRLEVLGPHEFFSYEKGHESRVILVRADGTEEDLTAEVVDGSDTVGLVTDDPEEWRVGWWAKADNVLAVTFPCGSTRNTMKVRAWYVDKSVGSSVIYSDWVTLQKRDGVVILPDLKGKGPDEAEKTLADAGLTNVTMESRLTRDDGTCADSSSAVKASYKYAPWCGHPVDAARKIGLFIEGFKTPDLTGMTRAEAEKAGLDAGLDLSFLTPARFDPNFPPDTVKAQGPKAGTCVNPGTKVVATLNPSLDVKVPDLIGKTEIEAGDIVRPIMLLLEVRKAKKWTRGFDAGTVVSQDPPAGSGPVKPGTKVTVRLNPALPSIGIDVIPDKPEYKIGEKISFAENVQRTNPNNTYTFTWEKDGAFVKADDSFTTSFDTPGRHYVQLILESSDPNENDAIIVNIHVAYPPDPTVGISVSPGGPYQAGGNVTLGARVANLTDATEYRWYVNDDYVGSGESLPYKLGGEGDYRIRLGVRRGSNFDELEAEMTIKVGGQAAKPFGKWRNRFEASGTTSNLKVCCSYWKPGFSYSQGLGPVKSVKGGWTKCSDFDTVGAVENYDLYTGIQFDLYNTGWIAYVPAGKTSIRFRVYGFSGTSGRVEYSGNVNSPGTPVPQSVRWAEKKGRAGKLAWRTEEGKSCSAWIYKTRGSSPHGTITQNVFVKGGVQDLSCTDDPGGGYSTANDPGMGWTGSASSTAGANTFGTQLQGGGGGGSGGGGSGSGSGSKGNLTNVTVNSRDVTITFWDHGQEDGDIINIYLNGSLLQGNIELKNKKNKFDVKLNSGGNTFEVEAVNEGDVPPNTASVRISNVTQGRSTQIYERKSGQRASMSLTAP